DKVKTTLKYTLKYYLAASIPSFFILSFLSKPILQILTTTQIAFGGYLITPFAALSTLLIGVCIIISQIILLEKKTKLIGFIWVIAAVLNMGLNITLIPIFGIVGAGLVTLVSYTLALVLLLHYSRKYIVFDMDLKFILKSILSSALASITTVIFYPGTVLTTGIVIFSFFAVYLCILIFLKGIKRNEIQFFKNLVFS
ncbi:MAG: polysaccharide biosynthesis C-terminal domain-containing protein, partial [Methanobacterium sp.]